MLRPILRTFIAISAVAASLVAFADDNNYEGRITGATCKEHFRSGVISQTWRDILDGNAAVQAAIQSHNSNAAANAQIQSSVDLPLQVIANLETDLNTPIGMRNAVAAAQGVMDQGACERSCSGLVGTNGEPFNCERLSRATSNHLIALTNSDEHLEDTARTTLTYAQLEELFADEDAAANPPPVAETQPEVTVEEPQTTAPVVNTEPVQQERKYGSQDRIVL